MTLRRAQALRALDEAATSTPTDWQGCWVPVMVSEEAAASADVVLHVLDVAEAGLLGADAAVGHPGQRPQDDADDEQPAGDRVLLTLLGRPRPRPGEEEARHGADVGQERGSPEVLVVDGAAPEHQHRDVDDGEDAE